MLIYKVKNIINKKIYIGKTTNTLQERKKSHEKKAKYKPKTHFHRALKKYGNDNFEWEILQTANNAEDLNQLEQTYIKKYNSYKEGYNMTNGGEGGDTISNKSYEEKKNQGAKKGNIPWNKGKSMRALGYTYEYLKPRTFTEEQKRQHSELIKNSEKFRKGLKSRRPAKNVVIKDENGKIWKRQKDFIQYMKENYNISHHKVRKGLSKNEWKFENRTFTVIKRK